GGVDRATGGTAIPSNTVNGAYTTLTGPAYYELATADIGTGTLVLKAPSGFIFDTNTPKPTVRIDYLGGSGSRSKNINNAVTPSNAPITSITTTTIVFTVTDPTSGGETNFLIWQNVRVRPTAVTPLASGNIVDVGTNTGFTGETTNVTSWGSLVEVG